MINLHEFKQSVLQKAMQGKLTKQLPSDGNASDLLKSIQQKKQELVNAKKIKRHKPFKPISGDEIPFEIPNNWKWVRLGNLSLYNISGNTPSKRDKKNWNSNGMPWISVKDIKNIYIKNSLEHISIKAFNTIAKTVPPYSFIVVVRMAIGKFAVNTVKLAINQDLRAFIVSHKILPWIIYFYQSLNLNGQGSTVKGITKRKLLNIIIPLPPLSEQKRIVRKVHKCFEFADTVQKERQLNQKFAKDMKQSLLRAAMQGKLTQQRPSDGNASDLLKSIRQRKQQLIKAKKIRKRKPLPPVKPSEIPFEIPRNWRWTRLGCIGSWKAGNTYKGTHPEYYKNGTIPWLRSGDLNNGYVNEAPERISKFGLDHSSLRVNPKGSVLLAMAGATIGKVGILNINATTNSHCCACVVDGGINNVFLFYYLLSQKYGFINISSGSAQPGISRTKIIHYLIPIPPLSEQKRIVSKLVSLFNKIGN